MSVANSPRMKRMIKGMSLQSGVRALICACANGGVIENLTSPINFGGTRRTFSRKKFSLPFYIDHAIKEK